MRRTRCQTGQLLAKREMCNWCLVMFERLHACLKSVAQVALLCSHIPSQEAQKSPSRSPNPDNVLDITLNRGRRLGLRLKRGPSVRLVLVGDIRPSRTCQIYIHSRAGHGRATQLNEQQFQQQSRDEVLGVQMGSRSSILTS